VKFENEDARKMYLGIINKALGGQFTARLCAVKGKEGVFSLSLAKTKDGGNLDKLGKGAQSFYKDLSNMIKSKSVASYEVVQNDDEVHIGNFEKSKIDVADISQFGEFDPNKDEQAGPTQAGKIIHETAEQFNKAGGEGVGIAHERATSFENATNGNTRLRDVVPGGGRGVIENFQLKNGSVVSFQIIGGQYSYKTTGTIILKPVPYKK
jgi:hypothetical protein